MPREYFALILGESFGREPERHGDGEGEGDGEGDGQRASDGARPGCPGGTATRLLCPAGRHRPSCGHSRSRRHGRRPAPARSPSPSSSAFGAREGPAGHVRDDHDGAPGRDDDVDGSVLRHLLAGSRRLADDPPFGHVLVVLLDDVSQDELHRFQLRLVRPPPSCPFERRDLHPLGRRREDEVDRAAGFHLPVGGADPVRGPAPGGPDPSAASWIPPGRDPHRPASAPPPPW